MQCALRAEDWANASAQAFRALGLWRAACAWAHLIADRFPDGQPFVNLRGHDPDQPVAAADALARFLVRSASQVRRSRWTKPSGLAGTAAA